MVIIIIITTTSLKEHQTLKVISTHTATFSNWDGMAGAGKKGSNASVKEHHTHNI